MLADVLLLLVLILLNGLFAMSEIAIVSARRVRLLQLADGGSSGAAAAVRLASQPTRFLSSVQVGITSIGIMNGAIGEGAIANRLRVPLEQIPALAPYAETLSLVLMVIILTYASLILGELVPKRFALTQPERIASLIARPMEWLATAGRPIVWLLSASTDAILRLSGARQIAQPAVTVEEIKVLLEQGADEGVVEPAEHEMVTNILTLDTRQVGGILTPRANVVFLEMRDPVAVSREKLQDNPHTVLPLCDGGLDRVLGFVRTNRLLAQVLDGHPWDPGALTETALFVPETMNLMKLLEQFKRMHLPSALVVDEFGGVQGLVSLTDVITSIVGDLPSEPGEEPAIVHRDDGSWLMDGALDLDTVMRTVDADDLLGADDRQQAHTLGGLAMLALGRVPRTGDVFERGGIRFEVVDMDGHRVDRLILTRTAPPSP